MMMEDFDDCCLCVFLVYLMEKWVDCLDYQIYLIPVCVSRKDPAHVQVDLG